MERKVERKGEKDRDREKERVSIGNHCVLYSHQ